MVESHLEAGRQDLVPGMPLRHGVSITDGCIGFEQTVPVLRALASAVSARRCCAGSPAPCAHDAASDVDQAGACGDGVP